MTTPEVVRLTVSTVHAALVDGPQFAVFTGPKVNGTFNDGGVSVGGVVEDSPNWFDEYASGQFV